MADRAICDACGAALHPARRWELYLCPPGPGRPYHADLCLPCADDGLDLFALARRSRFDPRLLAYRALRRLFRRGGR